MKILTRTTIIILGGILCVSAAHAQLSSNPDKFLGNITTGWNSDMDTNGFIFADYWNQVTPENATKWSSIEGTRGQYNFWGADKAYKYAKEHNFPFKFHTLVWGSQYPNWLDNLSREEQYEAIVKWMDAVKQHYPDLPMIDVVNEAIAGHAPAPYKDALGGDGLTGYDWIIRAFEMAHERWPNAILIYNDYNTFLYQRQEFINLVRTLRDAGAPIDAYGCQTHDLGDNNYNLASFKSQMKEIQDALKMPMYITEYDIGSSDDDFQEQRFREQFPVMWEADYCAGVTLWGWIYGSTWTTDGNSGIIRNGQDRPAMTWLKQYMQTNAAKNARSPFPGMKREAAIYVKCGSVKMALGQPVPIEVDASLTTKTIDHIEIYVNNQLIGTYSSAAEAKATYNPQTTGRYNVKTVVVATDGSRFERHSGFNIYNRTPHNGMANVPGTIEAEDFDGGAEGFSFHDSDTRDEGGTRYRSDNGGVDIVSGNGNYALGYTAAGEWTDYTVNVAKTGNYTFEAYASSGTTGSGFSVSLVKDGRITPLCKVNVSQTANNSWDTYTAFKGTFSQPLEAGQQILRISIDNPYCNIDKIVLNYVEGTGINQPTHANTEAHEAYNLNGQRVSQNYKGIVVIGGKKILKR